MERGSAVPPGFGWAIICFLYLLYALPKLVFLLSNNFYLYLIQGVDALLGETEETDHPSHSEYSVSMGAHAKEL